MEDRRGEDVSEGTPRPWIAQSYDDGQSAPWYIDTHAYPDGPQPVWAPSYPVSEADVTLIVTAVNAYDKLRAIEAAARAFMEYDDGPPDLPEEEWEPKARVLWDALSEVSSDAR
jgi:hypothetical protein